MCAFAIPRVIIARQLKGATLLETLSFDLSLVVSREARCGRVIMRNRTSGTRRIDIDLRVNEALAFPLASPSSQPWVHAYPLYCEPLPMEATTTCAPYEAFPSSR